jgi:hypothetical protein
MTRATVAAAAALVSAAALAGCGATSRSGETLVESVRTYHEGIRWSRIPIAASRIPPAERADFITEWDEIADDLRITDYEVVQMAQGDRTATVEVKYTWYLDSRQVVHETRASEDWERQGQVWIKVGERHARGERMPGLSAGDAAPAAAPDAPDSVDEAVDEAAE